MQSATGPAFAALEAWLANPAASVDARTLLEVWQHEELRVVCARPEQMEDLPDLAVRVRGALGNALDWLCNGPLAEPCGLGRVFEIENPHTLLFNWPPVLVNSLWGRLEVVPPMVIRAWQAGSQVHVHIRLFGRAMVHGPLVMEALVAALHGGVRLRDRAIHVPLPVLMAQLVRFDGAAICWPEPRVHASLFARTPVLLRHGSQTVHDPRAILRSLVRRAAGLAPWMGCALMGTDDTGPVDVPTLQGGAALREAIASVAITGQLITECWSRGSMRAGGSRKRMEGLTGTVHLTGNLAPLAPYLALAPLIHAGSSATLGLGALDLDSMADYGG